MDSFTPPERLRSFVASQALTLEPVEDQGVWQQLYDRCESNLKVFGDSRCLKGLEFLGLNRNEIPCIRDISAKPSEPDLFHEAFGHLCLLHDEDYRTFLRDYGRTAWSASEHPWESQLFDLMTKLCRLKAKVQPLQDQIAEIESHMKAVAARIEGAGEARRMARLFWWTVECGLVGSVENPKIYGAALVSSAKEGSMCLNSDVERAPFELNRCLETDFDPSERQTRLFVVPNFSILIKSFEVFVQHLATHLPHVAEPKSFA